MVAYNSCRIQLLSIAWSIICFARSIPLHKLKSASSSRMPRIFSCHHCPCLYPNPGVLSHPHNPPRCCHCPYHSCYHHSCSSHQGVLHHLHCSHCLSIHWNGDQWSRSCLTCELGIQICKQSWPLPWGGISWYHPFYCNALLVHDGVTVAIFHPVAWSVCVVFCCCFHCMKIFTWFSTAELVENSCCKNQHATNAGKCVLLSLFPQWWWFPLGILWLGWSM